MAPRQHAPPRRVRRGGYRYRRRRVRAPIGAGERRELVRNRLIESRLTPNAISLTGLALNLLAAALVWEELMFLGGIAFIVGSIMDTLDGRYSRMSGKGTPFGAFLDSTLDRIEEGIVLAAVAGYFALQGERFATAAVVVAALASLMVSYTRARAEALGVACTVGIATRPVRVVILSAGLVFARGASLGDFELLGRAGYVLAALTFVTVLLRVFSVPSRLGDARAGAAPRPAEDQAVARKVALDLSEAIWPRQNNTLNFAEVPHLDVPVYRGMTHDGLGKYLSEKITKAPGRTDDIIEILKATQTDVVV